MLYLFLRAATIRPISIAIYTAKGNPSATVN